MGRIGHIGRIGPMGRRLGLGGSLAPPALNMPLELTGLIGWFSIDMPRLRSLRIASSPRRRVPEDQRRALIRLRSCMEIERLTSGVKVRGRIQRTLGERLKTKKATPIRVENVAERAAPGVSL
jgi:hypothetical protein